MDYQFPLFEEENHASLYAKERISYPQDLKDAILEFLGEQPREYLLDVGCGPGQSTRLLTNSFKKVIGIDPSEAQIEEAKRTNTFENIDYKLGNGSYLPAENESVDLVTSAMALHWFNIPKFYEEVRRVLKPGGVLAVWGYWCSDIEYPGHAEESANIDKEYKKMFLVEWVEEGWRPKKPIATENSYKDLTSCFGNEKRFYTKIVSHRTIDGFLQLMLTFSCVQKMMEAHPDRNFLHEFKTRFLEQLGNPDSGGDTELKLTHQIFLILTRKP